MSVTSVTKNPEELTMTVVSEYPVTVERAWQLWDDPRQLERWWGPPTYPAAVSEHDLTPGGKVTYSMTGPEGDTHGGYWRVLEVEAPTRLVVQDGFANDDGTPDAKMPSMTIAVELSATDAGTNMTVRTTFPSLQAMEQLLAMGMEEGMVAAAGQIDEILGVGAAR